MPGATAQLKSCTRLKHGPPLNDSHRFISKTEVKTAEVYEGMIEDEGNILKYELTGVPNTSISYDPDDLAQWLWE